MILQLRKDLLFYQREGKPAVQWIVKDPVGFNHFLFSEEEFFLLQLFDGSRTLDQIRKTWQAEFKTRSLSQKQLLKTVHRLLADNLLSTDQFGYGKRLREHRNKAAARQFRASLSSPYLARIGSVNPKTILELLELPARFLFHPFTIASILVLSAISLAFFIGHFEHVSQRAGAMAGLFSYKNLVAIFVVAAIVKIFHELGHALACRRFGGDCFEIGLLLIAFFPTLYCDVSDSWTFKEKWKRILVAFAGIYVEIILALIASICWITTNPGFANTMFFNIAIMCSINSLLINGNPLLKYDGYYVASDLFNQPNLASRSRKQLLKLLNNVVFQNRSSLPIEFGLCAYGFLSLLYRLLVVLVILSGLYLLMDSAGFGQLAGAIVLGVLVLMMSRNIHVSSTISLKRIRTSFIVCTLLAVVAACFMPLPTYVRCSFLVEPELSSIAYAPRDGILRIHANSYEYVEKGQLLAEVIDDHLQEEIRAMKQKKANLERRMVLASKLQAESAKAAVGVEQLRNQITKTRSELLSLLDQRASLDLKAERSGLVRPIPIKADGSTGLNYTLESTFFDSMNQDIPVRRGQPLFAIEQQNKLLVSYLEENDVEHLEVGQAAVFAFDRIPGKTTEGTVSKIVETEFLPAEDANNRYGTSDQSTALARSRYRIVLFADEIPSEVYCGSSGQGRVSVASQTVLEKLRTIVNRWWN